jgi:penicillin-binding protein 1A
VTQFKSRLLAALAAGFLLVACVLVLAPIGAYYYLAPTLPDVATLRDVHLQVPLRVYTRDGRLIAQIGEQRRVPVSFEQIPKKLIEAFLAAEDNQFFEHSGIDLAGLLRAVYVSATTHEAKQGGSTITMQLARNMFLTPEKQIRRKLREIFLARRIESTFSKQEILTLYLNKIFLGNRSYGVAAAAEVYFGKPLADLSLAEMATIAGLPKAPSTINPIASPERALQRRAYVLRRMLDAGYISQADHDAALAVPMESQEHGPRVEVDAPYVAEMVRAEAVERFGDAAYSAGYRVTTTIDSRLQRSADWSLRAALLEYDRRHGYRGPMAHIDPAAADAPSHLESRPSVGSLLPALVTAVGAGDATVRTRSGAILRIPFEGGLSWARPGDDKGGLGVAPKNPAAVLSAGDLVYVLPMGDGSAYLSQIPLIQGALVSLDPADGAITALVGGFDFYQSKFNRAAQAKRQPGSSFKPFIYSGALERGFTPASVILDAPIVIDGGAGTEAWRPSNDSKSFSGPTRMRDGLARSRNLVSIRILRAVGVDYAVDYASRFGFPAADLPRNLTLALGTAQLTPLQMATAYSVFANGGYRVDPYLIDRVEDADGAVRYEASPRLACTDCRAEPIEAPGGAPAGAHATRKSPAAGPSGLDEDHLAPQAISAANAFIMTDMMKDVIRRGTARRALVLKRDDIAGKTGTTNDRRDTWFSGFNAGIVATAWVGFDQERNLGANEEGGHTALPMWVYFMSEAMRGQGERQLRQPDGVVSARVSPSSGQLAGPGDPSAVFEFFLQGKLPGSTDIPDDGQPGEAAAQHPQSEDGIF